MLKIKTSCYTLNIEPTIDKDKYQVFVMACRAHVPLGFAYHAWLVVNKKGQVSRFEMRHFNNKEKKNFGYLYINHQPPFQGLGVFHYSKKHFREAQMLGKIEGDEDSEAKRAIEYIEKSKKAYPYLHKYSLLGPNSNTYLRWVLDSFPSLAVPVSWRLIGFRYGK